jgi:hypothetical protein
VVRGIFLSFPLLFFKLHCLCNGICIVPVADLLKKSASETFDNYSSVKEAYRSLLMGDVNCKREYQILYNESVQVLQIKGDEAQIRVPHIIYFDKQEGLYTNIYWTLKKNLICLDELQVKNVNIHKIPQEVSFSQDIRQDESVVVLREPFIATDGRVFSAGTRFKMVKECVGGGSIGCYALNKNLQEVILDIPESKLNFYRDCSIKKRISDFVKLLRSWANLQSGFIPYLYSGSSYIYVYNKDDILVRGSDNTFYKDELKVYPYAGFDCSCIISRGAQICNLPYFYKDSTTLERNLDPVDNFNELSEGDIIWFQGHVVIISDIKNNLVVEARGYASGFGRVHECHLNLMFRNINSFKELLSAKRENKSLELLSRDGCLRYLIKEFKILSLRSGLYKEFKSLYNPVEKLDTSKCYKRVCF